MQSESVEPNTCRCFFSIQPLPRKSFSVAFRGYRKGTLDKNEFNLNIFVMQYRFDNDTDKADKVVICTNDLVHN